MFLLIEFVCGNPPLCLKVKGWVVGDDGWVGGWLLAYSILVSAQGPLVFGFLVFGFWGLGFRARA